MIIVIFAGGQGTRLWPLSQPNYPKHLLNLVDNNSLIQNTYKRASTLTKDIYIVTEKSHANEIKKQLPTLPASHILIEPGRRGTASCILLALSQLSKKHNPNEVIIFLHADHHITDNKSFKESVKAAVLASQELQKIALIGLQPDYPSTGFGYIKLGKEAVSEHGRPAYFVEKFVEKPDLPTAKKYVKSKQYLWNLGLFAAPIEVFLSSFKYFAPNLYRIYGSLAGQKSKATLHKLYLGLANEAIDTALIEKLDKPLVVPGTFDWTDIGSFNDLHELLKNGGSNVVRGQVCQKDCSDSLVIAGDKPIMALGLDEMVVIDSPHGVLVCPKSKSQLVKEGVELLNDLK
ncbi:mannose-1-phosphate guanylyltransferase [Candidatus Saccharibacteria bacterium]|nr:mannose-1-phosphate guanylyltransferase [Candidatus Saccharibacteria bacterium]